MRPFDLLRDLAPALTLDNGWRVQEFNADKPGEEEWRVSTVSYDADDDGRLKDYGYSILENIAPTVEENEYHHIKRALETLPEMLYLVAALTANNPESDDGKKAQRLIDYIRTGEALDWYLDS